MRGSAMLVVFMILAIVIALVVGFGIRPNLFGGGEGAVHKTSLQSNIYVMGHALEAADLYMDASLDYSVYQACYDNLRRAGLARLEGGSYNRLPKMGADDFYDELRATIEDHMEEYTRSSYAFMSDYRVVLPVPEIEVAGSESSFSVSALTTEKLTITKVAESSETITLSESLDSSGTYSIPCYSLFLSGRDLFDKINQTLVSNVNGVEQALKDANPKCQSTEECSKLFTKKEETILDSKYDIKSELIDSSVQFGSTTGGTTIYTYTIKATQKVTIREKEPTRYPVWNGNQVSFEPMELVFINSADKAVTLTEQAPEQA